MPPAPKISKSKASAPPAKVAAQPLSWVSPNDRDHRALPYWRSALYRSACRNSPIDLRIAFEIAAFADRSGVCTASNETLAERAGTDPWRVKDGVAALEACGLIIRQPVPRDGTNRTGRAIFLALPVAREGGECSPPSRGPEGGGTFDLRGVVGHPPNKEKHSDELREAVHVAAVRLNRKKAMAFRVFLDGVADRDDDEVARAVEIMQAALDDVAGGGRT